MPGARGSKNGRLEEALATVLQTQASMQENTSVMQHTLSAFLAQMAEMRAVADRRWRETRERFERMESLMSQKFSDLSKTIADLGAEITDLATELPERVFGFAQAAKKAPEPGKAPDA
jgi:hypothetical protein